jgi:polyisoprenyl-phosphate glycosyltransferase
VNETITLSVVLPVYREAEHIGTSLGVIRDVLLQLDVPFEIVCVDDGSPDATWAALQDSMQSVPELRAIKLSRNFGKEGAMLAGLEASQGEAVIVMDCDLQHPPSVIPEMLKLWQNGDCKIVDGVKNVTNRGSWLAEFGASLFYKTFKRIAKADLENSSDFKLLDREVVDAYLALRERRLFFRAMISWMGYTRARVHFDVAERTAGVSKFSPLKLLHMAGESVVSFSPLLLHGATVCGAMFLVFAIGLGLHTSYQKLMGRAIEGFATVIIIELVVGSIVLLGLGVIGAYIARIHEELKDRPRFLIEEELKYKRVLRAERTNKAA